MAPTELEANVAAAVARLRRAAELHEPCEPVRDLVGAGDVAAAYAVQRRLTASRRAAGGVVTGRKIGLTSPAVQAQLGVDRPDFGVLFADMRYDDGETVPSARLLQPRAEAEVAFVLGTDLDRPVSGAAGVRDAVAYACAAIEIVDSRIRDWDISFGDTVADNASSGLFVLGTERVPLTGFEPARCRMSMTLGGEVRSEGGGEACLGDPLNALAWLAATARELGDPLRAGEVVLSGALGPMVAVGPGDELVADISGLGTVRAVLG